MFVAVYGPEGVGKSSLISLIASEIEELRFEDTTLFHFKFSYLPNKARS